MGGLGCVLISLMINSGSVGGELTKNAICSLQLFVSENSLITPTLAWNNNLAERMVRPNVIYRNRSFGNRSDRGAEAHGTLMSLM